MPQLSKRVPGAPSPFKLTPFDPVGDSANVFSDAMRTVLAGLNVKTGTPGDPADKGFFPQASDLDNGNANLLDWCDHGLWLATDASGAGPARDYTGSFVYQEGHEANWKPVYFYRGNLIFRNVGATADLPAVSAPSWYRGGSIDLTPTTGDGHYGIQFRLKPSTAYTVSFYVKKLASGAFRFRVGTGNDSSFGNGTWSSEALASNLVNLVVDDTLAPPNTWTRISASFTTSASGYIWMFWGGFTSWSSSLPLRLAFPQLEEGSSATAWTPSRYWRYVEYPAPFDIDFTVTHSAGSDGFYLYQALPGSVYAHRFDVRPDWVNTTGDAPQYDRINPTSPTSSETLTRRPGGIGSSGQYHPMWEWSHTMISNLGGELYASTRRSSGNPYRIKGQVRGVWVRHTSLGGGGTIWADTNAVSGPGHRKFVAFRLTDTGSNNFRLKFASMLMLPGVQPDSSFYASAGAIADALIRPNAPYVQAVLTVNLQRNADVFIDGAGNEQGFVLNFFQGNTYQDVLAVADFVDSLHAADDGSVYPRWGMLVPNASVFYEIAGGFGPQFVPYWPGAGRGFHTCGHWSSGSWEPGSAPVLYQEVVLGYRQVDGGRKYPSPLYAARNDAVAANRGRLANFFVAVGGAVTANEGDTLNGGDGTDYYYADYRPPQTSSEALMLLVKP